PRSTITSTRPVPSPSSSSVPLEETFGRVEGAGSITGSGTWVAASRCGASARRRHLHASGAGRAVAGSVHRADRDRMLARLHVGQPGREVELPRIGEPPFRRYHLPVAVVELDLEPGEDALRVRGT